MILKFDVDVKGRVWFNILEKFLILCFILFSFIYLQNSAFRFPALNTIERYIKKAGCHTNYVKQMNSIQKVDVSITGDNLQDNGKICVRRL